MYSNMEDYYYPEMNPNFNPSFFTTHFAHENINQSSELEYLSDYLISKEDDGFLDLGDSSLSQISAYVASSEKISSAGSSGSTIGSITPNTATARNNTNIVGMKSMKCEGEHRVAFRTKSELEVMDDGFKWRKYGKKSVKNSPNPRNYYKCSSIGCQVKKRVERDREDPSFVITTYDGIHNHESPSAVYYHQMPLDPSDNFWTLQTKVSSPPSSSSS